MSNDIGSKIDLITSKFLIIIITLRNFWPKLPKKIIKNIIIIKLRNYIVNRTYFE